MPGFSKGASPRRRLDHGLTERELAVVRQMSNGLDRQGIAMALGMSLNTVKYHCKNIYSKLGVEGRIDAVHHARSMLEKAATTPGESGAD